MNKGGKLEESRWEERQKPSDIDKNFKIVLIKSASIDGNLKAVLTKSARASRENQLFSFV